MQLGYVILYVPDVAQAMAFYEDAFGLSVRFVDDSGTYGEMATGATKLAFASEELAASHGFDFEPQSPGRRPAAFEIAFVTQDVQAGFAKAIGNGARALTEPKLMSWGQWVSYVADLNGYTVEICSPTGAEE
ncbi:VOC family protein [Hoeflea sp. TYP-13]|uniref:VOC family protein n=1 Tax=Hoeflea sp. TYP-13 TaxID=3230023 RepID=UPI0034C6732D